MINIIIAPYAFRQSLEFRFGTFRGSINILDRESESLFVCIPIRMAAKGEWRTHLWV